MAERRLANNDKQNPGEGLSALDEPRLFEESGAARRVAHLIAPTLRDLGLRVVRIKISAASGCTVQIMAERADATMSIDDCEQASIAISPLLDLEDPIGQAYRLELSSPGVDRPLVRLSDFERALGHEAKVEMTRPIEGRKRFRGLIEAVEPGDAPHARIRVSGDEKHDEIVVDLPIKDMSEARLVLSEALIREALRREKAAKKNAKQARRKPKGAEAPEEAESNE